MNTITPILMFLLKYKLFLDTLDVMAIDNNYMLRPPLSIIKSYQKTTSVAKFQDCHPFGLQGCVPGSLDDRDYIW